MAAKKKQRSYSVDFKLKIFEEVEEKVLSKTKICKKYNIANSTLSTFLKNRKKIEQQNVSVSNGGARKRIREPVNSDVDEVCVSKTLNIM
jgi:transposase-like protein